VKIQMEQSSLAWREGDCG